MKIKGWTQSFSMPGEKESYFGLFHENKFYLGNNGKYDEFPIDKLPKQSTILSFDIKKFLNYPFPDKIDFIDLKIAFFCHDSGRHEYSMSNIAAACSFIPDDPQTIGEKFAFLEALSTKISKMENRSKA